MEKSSKISIQHAIFFYKTSMQNIDNTNPKHNFYIYYFTSEKKYLFVTSSHTVRSKNMVSTKLKLKLVVIVYMSVSIT